MAVTAQTPFSTFTAAPGATVFSSEFRVLQASDLVVKVNGAVITSGFSVSGIGAAGGVDVTFSTPMTGGEVVKLLREVPLTRATDYQQLGDFLSPVVNLDFDRIWMALQGIGSRVLSSIRAPYPEQVNELPSASERALKLMAFDALGNPTVSLPVEDSSADVRLDLSAATGAAMVGKVGGGTVQDHIDSRRIEGVVLTPPAGLGWTPPILPVHDGRGWRGHVSAKALFPANVGATYYVDPVNGVDTNAGTEAAPFKLISKALTMADVGEVLVAPAPNYSNDDGSWGNPTVTTSAAHVIVRPWRLRPGRPKVSNRWQHYPANWTNAGGGQDRVWTATRTSVSGVWDFSGAEPVQYVQLASQASCQNRPGTYFYDGTTIAVHTLNSVAPNRDLRIFIGNTCLYWASTKSLYVDGLDVEGGLSSVWVPNTTANLIFHDVSAGFTNGNAYQIETSGTVIMDGCTAKYAGLDGFNYHESTITGPGKFVEVNCRAHNIGWAGASTQASTSHDGTVGVRIGGEYLDAWLQLIADVNVGTKTWNVGGSLGRSSMNGTNSIGANVSEAIAWFYDFDFGASRNDLVLSSGGTAYIDRSRTKNASGALTYRQA